MALLTCMGVVLQHMLSLFLHLTNEIFRMPSHMTMQHTLLSLQKLGIEGFIFIFKNNNNIVRQRSKTFWHINSNNWLVLFSVICLVQTSIHLRLTATSFAGTPPRGNLKSPFNLICLIQPDLSFDCQGKSRRKPTKTTQKRVESDRPPKPPSCPWFQHVWLNY